MLRKLVVCVSILAPSTKWTLTLVLFLVPATWADAQDYAPPANGCAQTFYEPVYHWLSYRNTCSYAIHVTLVGIAKPHSGALDIKPGGQGGTAMSANEVAAVGGLKAYACPANYAAVDSADKLIIVKVVEKYACKNTTGKRTSFVYPTCDVSPDDREQACHEKKLSCNKNVYDWCGLEFGKEGTEKNRVNKPKYDSCINSQVAECATSQTQCVAKVRRCGSGQTCDARTEVCVAAPQ
jgi:hypothetical protein